MRKPRTIIYRFRNLSVKVESLAGFSSSYKRSEAVKHFERILNYGILYASVDIQEFYCESRLYLGVIQ